MILATCSHSKKHRHGKNSQGNQRYKCVLCGETFVDQSAKPLGNMRTSTESAENALGWLLEGCSVRSVQRRTGLCRQTLADLVLIAGQNCQRLLDAKVKAVPVADVQIDELHTFVMVREKQRLLRGYSEEFGDSWCFLAVERNSKLLLAHKVGKRDRETCVAFLKQLDAATSGRFQLSSDGLSSYRSNVPYILGSRVDYGVLVKTYAATQEVTRYAPAQIISAERVPEFGNPEYRKICTSHIEVVNRQVRQSLKRFARLTNAHSKSPKHHEAMVAIFVAWYNFCRTHETIKKTPAMAAGLTDKPWTIQEMLGRAAEA